MQGSAGAQDASSNLQHAFALCKQGNFADAIAQIQAARQTATLHLTGTACCSAEAYSDGIFAMQVTRAAESTTAMLQSSRPQEV